MKLLQYEKQRGEFEKKGFDLPRFDRGAVKERTAEEPVWLHFGAGNIFRAFPAVLAQRLLDQGLEEHGIIAAEGFDPAIIDRVYTPYDALGLVSILKADGTVRNRVLGSVTEALVAEENTPDWERLAAIFAAPSLQLVSFTITEKGYADRGDGSLIDRLARLLRVRFESGAAPLALVSMDNCSRNGEKLETAVLERAEALFCSREGGDDFLRYLADRTKITFPWTMIDKITPRPDEKVRTMLADVGFEDTDIVVTEKHSYVAPFVNAEEAEYLVIEDDFPNGRPPLEKAGVYMTDREHVQRVERMKVSTCLNPLHTALAIFGCLLRKGTIAEAMQDEDLKKLVYRLGYQEGMPVVVDPEIMSPKRFLDDVVTLRLPNPFLPDTPQRIATDTSQKLSVRFGETIKAYQAREDLRTEDLAVIPLVLAGWFRYLTGIGDDGQPFSISPDPLLAQIETTMKEAVSNADRLMHRADIFGIDLYEAGLDGKIRLSLRNMLKGEGAVRREIQRVERL